LEINNAAVGNEAITLNGLGLGSTGALTGVGTASLTGNVALASDSTIGVAAGADTLTLSGQVTGASALTKVGAGTLEFSGAAANTYSGVTTISAGTIALNKTSGVNAVVGDGASSKVTADIAISGGTLLWSASHQLADSVFINMTSGSYNLNGKSETIFDFTNSGGSFSTGVGGSLTVTDPTWTSGTNTINADSTATFGVLNISGGTNTVHGLAGTPAGTTAGGTLNIDAGGLNFSGTASPNLTINSDATSSGKVVLSGNVASTATAGTATISNGGAAALAGTVDLNGATRTFTVADGSDATDMIVSASIVGGVGSKLTKAGAGTLELAGAGTYTGDTDVNEGTLVVSGSLAGNVNVAAGAILASGNNLSSQVAALTTSSTTLLSSVVDPGRSGGSGTTSIGTLNANGNVTLGTSATELSTLRIEIAGNAPGTQYDQLNVLGTARTVSLTNSTLAGGAVNGHTFADATYDGGSGQFLTDGAKYFVLTLADNGSSLGGTKFANTLAPDSNLTAFDSIVIGGQLFAISFTANFSDLNNSTNFSGGNDVALMAIPEPNSLSMLAGSLGLALGLQRFRRRRSRS
jgi:autotransporter-associated beta strand protein